MTDRSGHWSPELPSRSLAATAVVSGGAIPADAVAVTPALLGNVEPALPSSMPNTVAVVANSAPVGADVGIVVRNGTKKTVDRVKVVGTAKAPGGGTVVRAHTNGLVPGALAPDGLGIANLKFGKAELPSGTTFSFKVRSKPAPGEVERPGARGARGAVVAPDGGPGRATDGGHGREPRRQDVHRPGDGDRDVLR